MSAKDLGWAEIVVGIILEFVPGGQAIGTKLIVAGAVTEASILLAPDPPKKKRAPTEGTLLQTDAYANLVYGQRKIGGVLVYERTSGQNNETLDMVVAHSITDPAYGIRGFRSFYLNDQELRVRPSGTWPAGQGVAVGFSIMDSNGNAQEVVKAGVTGSAPPTWKTNRGDITDDNTVQWKLVGTKPSDFTWDEGSVGNDGLLTPGVGYKYVHGHVTDGQFSGMVEVWAYMGTQAAYSDIDPTLYNTYHSDPELPWDNTAIGKGVVWTHWRFTPGNDAEAFGKAFGGNLPYKLEVVIDGETSPLDPRTGSRGYTQTPALIARDFLTRATENGGCGVDPSIIDDANTTNPSANVCEQTVTMADGTQAPRFKANGVVSMGNSRQQELKKILMAMAGFLVNRSTSVNNVAPVGIYSGSYSAPVGTIDESFLRGSCDQTDESFDRRYNLVRATYTDQNNSWQSMSAPPYPALASTTFANWKAEDGGEELDQQIQLDFVTDSDRAQLIAAIVANKSRYPESIKMQCNYKPIAFNVFDRVWYSNAEKGISSAIYRITRMKRLPTWCWDIELQQDDPSIWGSVIPTAGEIIGDSAITSSVPPDVANPYANPQLNGQVVQWDSQDQHRVKYTEVWVSSTQNGTYTLLGRSNSNSYFNRAGDVTTWYKMRASNGTDFSNFTVPVSAASATLDNLPDGGTYGRPLGSYLKGGRPYNYRGAYSGTTVYNQGDEVSANGNYYLYISPTAASGIAVTNAGSWQLLGPATLDDVNDGTTYLRMPGANMDGNRRGLVDFAQGGHVNKNLDNIGDGSTYRRMPGANMDGNRRGLIDFGQGGHVNKNLDNLPDGGTFGRPLLKYLSGGVPYNYQGPYSSTQVYHQGDDVSWSGNYYKYINSTSASGVAPSNAGSWQLLGPATLDDLGDGATYLRMPGANMDGNRRGLVDFSQTGHLNKNTDNIAETATDFYWKASQQTALITNKGGENHVADPGITSADFWGGSVAAISSNGLTYANNPLAANASVGGIYYNQDGRGNTAYSKVDSGDYVYFTFDITVAATGTARGYYALTFFDANKSSIGNEYVNVNGNYTSVGSGGYWIGQAPANARWCALFWYGTGGTSGGNMPTLANPVLRIGSQTVTQSGGARLGDVRNVGGNVTGGIAFGYWDSYTFSSTYNSANNTSTCNWSGSTYHAQGKASIVFPSSGINGLAPGSNVWAWIDCPNMDGSGTINVTTNKNLLTQAVGRFYIPGPNADGSFTLATSSGGTGGGGGGLPR